jgi:hypothetical protein
MKSCRKWFVVLGLFSVCGLAFAAEKPAPTTKPSAVATTGPAVTPEAQLQFQQKNAQAQMQELEERMFRLGELLRQTEAGDAAKLIMAFHKAREQLILEDMKDIIDMLGEQRDLSRATDEEKKVLVKLEELKRLLLATDLDLQMQLEMLKKINAAIAKVDQATKEEKRQKGEVGKMADQQKKNMAVDPSKQKTAQTDQTANQKLTDAANSITKELGEMGTKAGESLGAASKSMGGAAGKIGSGKPSDAMTEQGEAIKKLEEAKASLEDQRKKLMAEIEKQVRKQVIENLSEMLERQVAVRQATERLSPKLATQDREASINVKKLAAPEQRIVAICDSTIELIEQTQFSQVLPMALKSIQRRMLYVTADLQGGRGNAQTIDAEKQIERDLKDLIDTFKQLNQSSNQPSNCKSCNGDKNKLLAELKVLRMLQTRVNEETKDADGRRNAALKELPPELKKKIGSVTDMQSQVEEATDKLHHMTCPDCLSE